MQQMTAPDMRTARQPKADPAPSRLRYRLHRLMLTPMFRLMLRVGIPFCLSAGATLAYLSDEERRDDIVLWFADMRATIEQRPEFMVDLMAIDGASTTVAEDIREVVPIDFPISSFDLNLDEIRETVAGLDPVKRAAVRIRPGGVLQVDVSERTPIVVWRTRDGLELLDETGTLVGELAARGLRPELPLIAGKGADAHVREAIDLLATAAPLNDRIRGLQRVGERRWNLILDPDLQVMLPEQNPAQALQRVLAMNRAMDLLQRDLSVVDMRNPDRPTLRMTDNAMRELWRIRQIQVGDGDQ